MKTYFRTCPDCGAHLDPGERCDCGEPRWQVELLTPDGARSMTVAHGSKAQVIDLYAAQGATVTRMVPLNAC